MQSSLSAREHLAWYAALYGFARAPALERVGTLLERVGLASHALRPLRELSTGMRRRVALARALIGDPEVIILDEPTRGVDPAGASALHGHLLTELEGGRTVVIATHDRVEARTLCARVAVLQASRLVTIERADDAATRLLGMQIG
jgi:ABC-2 type transport system ATP-binding protein